MYKKLFISLSLLTASLQFTSTPETTCSQSNETPLAMHHQANDVSPNFTIPSAEPSPFYPNTASQISSSSALRPSSSSALRPSSMESSIEESALASFVEAQIKYENAMKALVEASEKRTAAAEDYINQYVVIQDDLLHETLRLLIRNKPSQKLESIAITPVFVKAIDPVSLALKNDLIAKRAVQKSQSTQKHSKVAGTDIFGTQPSPLAILPVFVSRNNS
jgi:hypothetical protein